MNPDTFLTVSEVAKYLGLAEYTVRKYARDSLIPAIKLGREWKFQSHHQILAGLSITRGNKLQHATGRVLKDFSFPEATTTDFGIFSKPKPKKKKPADTKNTRKRTIETRIEAARAVFDKYAPFLAEVEAELNHPPGFLFEMILGSQPQNPCSNGFQSRATLQDQSCRDTTPLADEAIPSAAWELSQVFGNLEHATLKVQRTAAKRIESVIRRHHESLAA